MSPPDEEVGDEAVSFPRGEVRVGVCCLLVDVGCEQAVNLAGVVDAGALEQIGMEFQFFASSSLQNDSR